MNDEIEWRRRFRIFAALRIAGVLLFIVGTAIAFTDVLKPDGWPLLGGILAITGAIEAVLIGRHLKRNWDE